MGIPGMEDEKAGKGLIEKRSVWRLHERNGLDFGANLSGLGNEWLAAPCLKCKALYFPGVTDLSGCRPEGKGSRAGELRDIGCIFRV